MTLAELAEHVTDKAGVDSADMIALAKKFIKRRYKNVFDKYPWKDGHTIFQFRTLENDVILPDWVDKVVQVRLDNAEAARNLQMVSKQTMMLVAPGAVDDTGARVAYTPQPSVAVHTHPEGNKVRLQSSDASDTTQSVRLRGMFNGLTIEETVQLAGMTWIESESYFDEITHFSKGETTGWVTLQSMATGNPELGVILAAETERRYTRIQLLYDFEATDSEEVISVLAKRRCIPLRHDNDTPQLSNLDDVLIAYGIGDMLERERQFAKAQLKFQEAVGLLNEMVLAERDQQQNQVQIIPETEEYAEQSTLY